jgi:hypothetical protein
MTHRVFQHFEDNTTIEVVVTAKDLIINTYADQGQTHTGTFCHDFQKLHDFVQGHGAGIFPQSTRCWCQKQARGYYGQPTPVCGIDHAEQLKQGRGGHSQLPEGGNSDIEWVGFDNVELQLIEDVMYSLVKQGDDPNRDEAQSIIRTIDSARSGDWSPPWMECPVCHSTDIESISLPQMDGQFAWSNIACGSCGATWQEIYKAFSRDYVES